MIKNILRFFTKAQNLGIKKGFLEAPLRIVFILDAIAPTYTLSFELPLEKSIDMADCSTLTFTQNDFLKMENCAFKKLQKEISQFQPTHFIFSRYGGRYANELLELCKTLNCKSIYHLDDNLFSFPEDMLDVYKKRHLTEDVIAARTLLITRADITYFSTTHLEKHLKDKFSLKKTFTGIYCPYPGIDSPLPWNNNKTLGYMGTKSHLRDLHPYVPFITDFLAKNSDWTFELFGDLSDLHFDSKVKNQVIYSEPVRGYEKFRQALNAKKWSAAISPLQKDMFNLYKAPTKFVEYTCMGAISLLTNYGPYEDILKKDAALNLDTISVNELSTLLNSTQKMQMLHQSAQSFCLEHYPLSSLENQLHSLLKN